MTESIYGLQLLVKCINTSLGHTFFTRNKEDTNSSTAYEVTDHLEQLEQCDVVECLL